MIKSKPATRIFFEELEDSPVVWDVSWRCSSATLQKRSSDVHEILFDSSWTIWIIILSTIQITAQVDGHFNAGFSKVAGPKTEKLDARHRPSNFWTCNFGELIFYLVVHDRFSFLCNCFRGCAISLHFISKFFNSFLHVFSILHTKMHQMESYF